MEDQDEDIMVNKLIQAKPKKPAKNSNKPSIKAIEATIHKKKECNAKALDIVIRFSEGTISEICMIENLQFINQEHYQDIVEERAISKLCGYPLCSTQLRNIPAKKYHISTSHNKVFDITDRKNFCSNMCYKASKFLKDQISTSPLWLRDDLPNDYKLIPLHNKGGNVGDEVDLGFTPIKVDDDVVLSKVTTNSSEALDNKQLTNYETIEESMGDETVVENSLSSNTPSLKEDELENSAKYISSDISKYEHSKDKEVISEKIQNDNTPLLENERVSECQIKCENIDQRTDVLIDIIKSKEDTTGLQKQTHGECKEAIKKVRKEKKVQSSCKNSCLKNDKQGSTVQVIISKIERILREWISLESLCFIFGEEKLKEMLGQNSYCVSQLSNVASRTMDAHVYERYLAICKKLNILELEDTKVDMTYREDSKKPLPDYAVLKEEAKVLDLKVRMFYKGDKLVQFEEPHENVSTCKDGNKDQEPVLPLVDLHAQKALRRRIVIDKLKRVLQDLLKSLRLKNFDLFEQIQTLVSTFDLSAHNITMRPAEWNFITIVIIKLLSVRDKTLEQALLSNPTNKYLTLLLMSYSADSGYLDRLIVWLTDIESVLQKQS